MNVVLSSSLSQVHRVFSQGAASQEGTVSRGDVLLSVNGTPLADLAHGDVLKVLHQAQLHKDVLMVIRRGGDRPRPSSGQEPPTANGKSSLSRRAIPPEPGMGKTAAGQPAGASSWHTRFWLNTKENNHYYLGQRN